MLMKPLLSGCARPACSTPVAAAAATARVMRRCKHDLAAIFLTTVEVDESVITEVVRVYIYTGGAPVMVLRPDLNSDAYKYYTYASGFLTNWTLSTISHVN